MAGVVSGGRLGCFAGQADYRSAPPSHRKADSLGLSNCDDEESAATEVPVCLVDAHNDREIDCGSVRGQTERGFGRPVAGAVGVDLPAPAVCCLRTESEPGRAMVEEGISANSRGGPENRG